MSGILLPARNGVKGLVTRTIVSGFFRHRLYQGSDSEPLALSLQPFNLTLFLVWGHTQQLLKAIPGSTGVFPNSATYGTTYGKIEYKASILSSVLFSDPSVKFLKY